MSYNLKKAHLPWPLPFLRNFSSENTLVNLNNYTRLGESLDILVG